MPMSELAKLSAGLDQLLALMSAAEKAADSGTAARLQGLSAELREKHTLFAAEMEKVSAHHKQKMVQTKQNIAALKQQSAQAKQEVASAKEAAKNKKKAKPPAAAPPPTPIDPELARKTRIELLKRFGGLTAPPTKEDWELWDQLDKGL
jgi:hypothetical protein